MLITTFKIFVHIFYCKPHYKPSKAPVGASEVRGRSSSNKKPDQKKVNKTLESWVQGPNKGTEGPATRPKSLKKRATEDNQPRKGFKDIRRWFEGQGLAQEGKKERQDLKPEPEVEPTSEKEPTG